MLIISVVSGWLAGWLPFLFDDLTILMSFLRDGTEISILQMRKS
jgi:hypothetical protein